MASRKPPGRPKKDAALVVLPLRDLTGFVPSAQQDGVEEAFRDVQGQLNSKESERAYQREWASFVRFLHEQRHTTMLAAKTSDVMAYLETLRAAGLGKASRARALAVIRVVYAALVRADVLPANPAREARNPKGSDDQKTPVLTEAELETYLSAVPDESTGFREQRNYLIALTAAYTGLRRASLAVLVIDKFKQKPGTKDWLVPVRIKGDKTRDALILEPLAEALFGLCRANGFTAGYVFRGVPTRDKAVSLSTVRNAVIDQARRAGITDESFLAKISPHTFRRTFATISNARGVSVQDLQRDLMHARRETTDRYIKRATAEATGAGRSFLDLASDPRFRKDKGS